MSETPHTPRADEPRTLASARYVTRELYGDAYSAAARRSGVCHTHSARVEGSNLVPLCRVKPEHVVDEEVTPGGDDQPPTCPTCLRRDPRFNTETPR